MFTGIVQAVAKVQTLQRRGAASVLSLPLPELAAEIAVGDSVLVNGVCLTACRRQGSAVDFDVSSETLRRTALGDLRPGQAVNVELALRPTDRFGGHFVSGHVDGVGRVAENRRLPGEQRLRIAVDRDLAAWMIPKGSVAVDGVSLTIAGLGADWFAASLIPHTLAASNLDGRRPGDSVNIECDMIGKWVRKLLGPNARTEPPAERLNLETLEQEGY
jgi:riboflavin synthase